MSVLFKSMSAEPSIVFGPWWSPKKYLPTKWQDGEWSLKSSLEGKSSYYRMFSIYSYLPCIQNGYTSSNFSSYLRLQSNAGELI